MVSPINHAFAFLKLSEEIKHADDGASGEENARARAKQKGEERVDGGASGIRA